MTNHSIQNLYVDLYYKKKEKEWFPIILKHIKQEKLIIILSDILNQNLIFIL